MLQFIAQGLVGRTNGAIESNQGQCNNSRDYSAQTAAVMSSHKKFNFPTVFIYGSDGRCGEMVQVGYEYMIVVDLKICSDFRGLLPYVEFPAGHRQAVARFASQIEGTAFSTATRTLLSYTADSCLSTTRTKLLNIFRLYAGK